MNASALLNSPPRAKAVTRNDTTLGRYRYVDESGEYPTDTDWEYSIVILDAHLTQMDGPVFGIVGGPASVVSKSKQKSSQREGVYVRELYGNSMGSEEFIADRNRLEFVSESRHKAQLDQLRYRAGRIISDEGLVQYVQVTETYGINPDEPTDLIVVLRGEDPDVDSFEITPSELTRCSMVEYVLNYGGGEPLSSLSKINKSGCLLEERITCETDLIRQRSNSKSYYTITCDMGQELTFLNQHGENEQTTPEEYMVSEVFDDVPLEPEAEKKPVAKIKVKQPIVKKETKSKIKVKVPKVPKTKKKISFVEADMNSESELDDEIDDDDADQVEPFVVVDPPSSSSSVNNKYSMQVNELGLQRHNALFNDQLLNGKWKSMSIEARAERLIRMESKRGKYETTKTAFLIWFFGNFGTDPIAYLLPYAKVPTSEKQCIPNGKWTTSVNPARWIMSMKDLSQCLDVLTGIARLYFKPDVYIAIEAISQKAYDWHDMDLAMAGVNAYRDLFQGALGAIVDGAVDGLKGNELLECGLHEVHPASKAYSEIICDRLQRVTAGSQWGPSQARAGGGRGGGGDKDRGGGKKDAENTKSDPEKPTKPPLTMSEEQKNLVPKIGDRKVCLANMSARGCITNDCHFLHDGTAVVPQGLKNYFRKRFGKERTL